MMIGKAIILLLFAATASTANAQLGKMAGKAAVKSAVKAEMKAAVKSTVKSGVKRQAVKTATRQSAKVVLEREGKQAAARSLGKGALSTAGKGAAGKALKAEATRGASEVAGKAAARKTGGKVAAEEAKTVEKKSFSSLAKERLGKGAAKPVEKQIGNSLSKRALEEWKAVSKGSAEMSTVLAKDLGASTEFANAINKNPALLKNYANLIGSPRYRTNLTVLRYANYNSNKMYGMYTMRKGGHKWLSGDDLVFRDKGNVTVITQKGSDIVLGEMEGEAGKSLVVRNAHPDLLNLYPMRNTKYIYQNCEWVTDNLGRPRTATVRIDKSLAKAKREKEFIGRVKTYKEQYNADGSMKASFGKTEEDIAGHLAPDAYGGPSCAINIVPQKATVNGSGVWKISEDDALRKAKSGSEVTRRIELVYDDGQSLRPAGFKLTQRIDGEVAEYGGQRLDGLFISNR